MSGEQVIPTSKCKEGFQTFYDSGKIHEEIFFRNISHHKRVVSVDTVELSDWVFFISANKESQQRIIKACNWDKSNLYC